MEEGTANARRQVSMLIVVNLEQRIPKANPLRQIKQMADTALKESSSFEQMYSRVGRPSVPPEHPVKRE